MSNIVQSRYEIVLDFNRPLGDSDDTAMLEQLLRTAPQRGGWSVERINIHDAHATLEAAIDTQENDSGPGVDRIKRGVLSALRGYSSNIADEYPRVETVVEADSRYDSPRNAKHTKTKRLRKQNDIGHKEWVVDRENPDKPGQLTADMLVRTVDAGPTADEWLAEEDAATDTPNGAAP